MTTPSRSRTRTAAAAPEPHDEVALVDLEVVRRWSLALRHASAPRAEVVAALEADLRALREGAAPAPARRRATPRPRPRA